MSNLKTKPKKPYPDFPLTAHNNGQWCKKIQGKVHFFGVWENADQALQNYCDVRDDLQAGRQPRQPGVVGVRDLVNHFLTRAQERCDRGEITSKTFSDYHMFGQLVVEHLGKNVAVASLRTSDFASFRHELGQRYAVTGLTKIMTVIRMIFRWGYESELFDVPVRFGPDFKVPSKKSIRIHKAERGKKFFEAHEIRTLLEESSDKLIAMILLGINGGFGNTDVGELKWKSIDLNTGWINFPRKKTGIDRRIPLWKETIKQLEKLEANSDLVFRTRNGNPYVWQRDGKSNDEISKMFRKQLCKLDMLRSGLSFYALRHTFQTIGDESKDPVAVSAIMGHIDGSMAGQYREKISDERLRLVVDQVHDWVFPPEDSET